MPNPRRTSVAGVMPHKLPVLSRDARNLRKFHKIYRKAIWSEGSVLPGVQTLLNKKKFIIRDVQQGNISEKLLKHPSFRALFSKEELATLNEYASSREYTEKTNVEKVALLKKIRSGVLTKAQRDKLVKLFEENELRQLTIFYNNRMEQLGKKGQMLAEDEQAINIRRRKEVEARRKLELTKTANLLLSLKEKKISSAREFTQTLGLIGPDAIGWFRNLRYDDRQFVLKFAVGENEKILDPYQTKAPLKPISITDLKNKLLHDPVKNILNEQAKQKKKK